MLRLLAAEGVVSVDGIVFEVLFTAAFSFSRACPKNQEKIPMVPANAVVTAHGEPKKQEPKEIFSLPAGGVNVGGIAESTFHWALVMWKANRIE